MSKLVNEASIPELLKEMTVQEKVDLLTGETMFSSPEMPQYGIPSVLYLDGATGVNMMQYLAEIAGSFQKKQNMAGGESSNESGASAMGLIPYVVSDRPVPDDMPEKTKNLLAKLKEAVEAIRPNGEEPNCFPPGMLLGATWEPETVYQVGKAVAREANAYGVDILLGTPNTNIHRDPRNGRVFESFSEDPYLSSHMAPQFPKGVQEQGMVADVKHFAANNQETLRQGINEHISERALREIYLPGFEAAVKEGKVGTVMSAYNSINGVPCAHNKWLLTDVLKEEWGFDGQVVSDWGAVYDQVEALKAGNDMDMPGPRGKQRLYDAVADGTIPMERLDDAVARTLRMILKTPKFRGERYTEIDNELSRKAAYYAASEGITLLKNDGILPLKKNTKVALYGRLTRRFMESGSGSAQVDTSKYTNLPDEAARYTDTVLVDEIAEDTDVVIITAGASGQEGKDRPDLHFDAPDEQMLWETLKAAKEAGKKTILLLNVAGPVELGEYVDDLDAVMCLFFPGMAGAAAAADILFGAVSPSGKLPLTFPKTYLDMPTALNFPGEFGNVVYGEGIFVGYRYYDTKKVEPLYPFGYGLSYSSFSIKDAKVSQTAYDNRSTEPLQVSVTVKNEGDMEAKEVVQLYVHDVESTLLKPEKELKGFQKVSLKPGEEKAVTFELLPHAFASYDTEQGRWTEEPGEYELLLGNSSRNITASVMVTLTGKNPYGCSLSSAIAKIAADKEACGICVEVLGDLFDFDSFMSSVTYFGDAKLEDYLNQYIRGIDKKSEKWEKMLQIIRARLADL